MHTIHRHVALRALPLVGLVLLVLLPGCASSGASSPVAAQRLAIAYTGAGAQTGALVEERGAPSESSNDQAAAVQTVVDYYEAINQRRYERAYKLWSRDGAASNQTLPRFRQGFANTVRVQLRIGSVRTKNAQIVVVPVVLTAVVNDPAAPSGQKVQRFSGDYEVQSIHARAGSATWRLLSARIAVSTRASAEKTPVATIRSFYAAINRREFAEAYTTWADGGKASKRSFAHFQQGFASTQRVSIDVGEPMGDGAAGTIYAHVPILIVATNTNQSQQTFCGVYTLRRVNAPPFDQLGWSIARASIKPTASVQPGSAQARHLVSGGC